MVPKSLPTFQLIKEEDRDFNTHAPMPSRPALIEAMKTMVKLMNVISKFMC
jgi:hypothetical protein